MRTVSLLFSAALVFLLSSAAAAQHVEVQAVKLTNGTIHHGRVIESADSLSIELASGGTLMIARSQVRSITTVRGQMRDGEFWVQDLNETRLFFAPTARTLPRGAGYISTYQVILPFVGYGVTDAITLAGGVVPFFGGGSPLVGYVAPKVRVLETERMQVAVGALAFFNSDAAESAGMVYAVTSLGRSSDTSASLGAGFGYAGSEIAHTPVLMGGFETRTSRRSKLVSENWIFPRDGVILSIGPRLMGERMAGDLGLAMALFGDGALVFPLVNFVWNW